MTETITLRCPEGAEGYPISFDTVSYRPYMLDPRVAGPATWLVDMPRERAAAFIGRGGFSMATTVEVMRSAGSIPITHPDPKVTGISLYGKWYEFDKDRKVEVPIEAITDGSIASHPGFRTWEGPAPEPEIVSEPPLPPPPSRNVQGVQRAEVFPADGEHPDGGPQAKDMELETPVAERKTSTIPPPPPPHPHSHRSTPTKRAPH